jgi:hypothetical protein
VSAEKHGASFEVVDRGPDHVATAWLASCKCKVRFIGATYEEAEDKWRQHVHEVTGKAPKPFGNQDARWSA